MCTVNATVSFTLNVDSKLIVEHFPQVERRQGSEQVRITLRQPPATVVYHHTAQCFQMTGVRSEAEVTVLAQKLLKMLRLIGYATIDIKSISIGDFAFHTDVGFKVALDKLAAASHGVYNPESSPGCVLTLTLPDKEICTAQVFFSGKAQLHVRKAALIDTALAKLLAALAPCRVL